MIRKDPITLRLPGERDIMWIKRKFSSKLASTIGTYMFVSGVASTLIVVTCLILLLTFNIEDIIGEPKYQGEVNNKVSELQMYIDEKRLTSNDILEIFDWNRNNDSFFFMLLKNDSVIYDSNKWLKNSKYAEAGEKVSPIYTLHFSDSPIKVKVLSYYQLKYHELTVLVLNALAFVVFILIFNILLKKKVHYIAEIEKRIRAIGNGNLEEKIPLHGKDELATLADNINNMALTIKEQYQIEEQLKKEKTELISSVSHDIRTPLTTVICYLDLLAENKVDNEEKKHQYIEHIRNKAYLIKDLTDDLFNASICSNQSINFNYEILDGREVFSQLLSDTIFMLENEDFAVQLDDNMREQFTIRVDINQLIRVFDNLSSNIIKYADSNFPIYFTINKLGKTLTVTQVNHIYQHPAGNSSGLGLNTSQTIIERHCGVMNTQMENDLFSIQITLPVF